MQKSATILFLLFLLFSSFVSIAIKGKSASLSGVPGFENDGSHIAFIEVKLTTTSQSRGKSNQEVNNQRKVVNN